MLQTGSCQINHLIFKSFPIISIKAGIDSLPFAIFVVQNKEKWIYENASAHYVQIGSEKLKFSKPNKSFIKWLTNFALVGWLYVKVETMNGLSTGESGLMGKVDFTKNIIISNYDENKDLHCIPSFFSCWHKNKCSERNTCWHYTILLF